MRAEAGLYRDRLVRPELQRALLDEYLRRDFPAFSRKCFETVDSGKDLFLNWHLDAMAYEVGRVIRGENRRLLITIPPRHFKSIMCSVALPAFVLGHDPTRNIVCISYGNELVIKHATASRTVLRSDWYQRIFPATRIGEKDTELDVMTTRRGGRFATSLGGGLTGRGGDLFIIDDPQKPEDAMSEVSRPKAKVWFESTFLSRLNDKQESAVIVLMQRLHVDDLAGTLLAKGGWTHFNVPAIAEEDQTFPLYSGGTYHRRIGDLLDPRREPQHILDELKASMGTMAFSAQYQQRPVPVQGNLIKREWFRFYDHQPSIEGADFLVVSWDTAMKADQLADFTVGTIWLVKGQTCYLLDLVRDKFEFPSLKRAVLAARQRFPTASILVEDKGSGMSLIQQLRQENVSVIPIKPVDDKITRLHATTPMFEAGSVVFPRQAPWLDELINELLAFPNYSHDDQVDSISQALTWIRNHWPATASHMFIYSTNDYPDFSSCPRFGGRDYDYF